MGGDERVGLREMGFEGKIVGVMYVFVDGGDGDQGRILGEACGTREE